MAIKISREQLYKEVWETSMVVLAKKYNLSDNGLAKICKRVQIPKPPVGYWAAKNKEKYIKPELPTLENNSNELIFIDDEKVNTSNTSHELIQITVPRKLSKVHKLTEQTLDFYDKLDQPYEVRGSLENTPRLSIRVEKKNRARALRIMNTIIHAFEERRHTVVIEKSGNQETQVIIKGEKLSYGILELSSRVKLNKGGYSYNDLIPTGNLQLYSNSAKYSPFRASWKDGEKQRVEDCLGDFILNIELLADYEAKRTLEREKEKALSQIRRQKAYEEEQRIEELEEDLINFNKAKDIRLYLKEFQEALGDKNKYQAWIAWGYDYANQMDPLYPEPIIKNDITVES